MTAYQLLLNCGERTVPAGTASLLVNVSPVFTAIAASLWLDEGMTPLRWAGVAIACSGATLIAVAGRRRAVAQGGALLDARARRSRRRRSSSARSRCCAATGAWS